jgi:hypothetical protein
MQATWPSTADGLVTLSFPADVLPSSSGREV